MRAVCLAGVLAVAKVDDGLDLTEGLITSADLMPALMLLCLLTAAKGLFISFTHVAPSVGEERTNEAAVIVSGIDSLLFAFAVLYWPSLAVKCPVVGILRSQDSRTRLKRNGSGPSSKLAVLQLCRFEGKLAGTSLDRL